MRMHNLWAQNGPFAQMRISFRKPVNEPCFFHSCLSTSQKLKSDITVLVKEYWNLIGWEPLLTITWETDFSQACSFCKMLMNHRNFHFTQIPDKANDLMFLKETRNHDFGPFLTIFGHFCLMWIFSKKSGSVTHNYIRAPNIMLSFRKNQQANSEETYGEMEGWTEGRMEGWTDPIL